MWPPLGAGVVDAAAGRAHRLASSSCFPSIAKKASSSSGSTARAPPLELASGWGRGPRHRLSAFLSSLYLPGSEPGVSVHGQARGETPTATSTQHHHPHARTAHPKNLHLDNLRTSRTFPATAGERRETVLPGSAQTWPSLLGSQTAAATAALLISGAHSSPAPRGSCDDLIYRMCCWIWRSAGVSSLLSLSSQKNNAPYSCYYILLLPWRPGIAAYSLQVARCELTIGDHRYLGCWPATLGLPPLSAWRLAARRSTWLVPYQASIKGI